MWGQFSSEGSLHSAQELWAAFLHAGARGLLGVGNAAPTLTNAWPIVPTTFTPTPSQHNKKEGKGVLRGSGIRA